MLTFSSQEKKKVEDKCFIFAESLCSNVQAVRGDHSIESEWLRLEMASGGHLVHSLLGVKLEGVLF